MIDAAQARWRDWRHPATVADSNIRYLVVQTAFAGIINGGITTFLPVFLVRLGASGLLVSLLTSSLALTTIVMALPSAAIVARQRQLVAWSARYFMLVRAAYALCAAAALLEPVLAAPLIVLIWGASGIPAAVANTAWYTILAESVPARRRPVVNGFRWALIGLVSAASVFLFGIMLDRLPFPLGYQVVFFLSFVAGAGQMWLFAKIVIPNQKPAPPAAIVRWRARLAGIVEPLRSGGDFAHYVIATSVLRVGLYLPIGLFSVFWVRDLGATDAFIGVRTLVGNGALTIGYYTWGRIAGRLGHRRTLAFAASGLGIYPIMTGLAPSVEWLVPAAFVWGLFASGIDVSLFEGILDVAPAGKRSRYVALNTFLANIIALVVPLAGASVAGVIGIPPVLMVAGALHFVSVIVVGILAAGARKRPTPIATD